MLDKKIIKKFKDAIKACECVNFIEPDLGFNKLLECCEEFLVENNYKVIKLKKAKTLEYNTVFGIVSLFKDRMKLKHPNRIADISTRHSTRDLRTASNFIKTRMIDSNINKQMAIQECCGIIVTFVDNLREFDSIKGIVSFSIFGQDKMKWVSDRCIGMLRGETTEISERNADILEAEYEKKAMGEIPSSFIDMLDDLED